MVATPVFYSKLLLRGLDLDSDLDLNYLESTFPSAPHSLFCLSTSLPLINFFPPITLPSVPSPSTSFPPFSHQPIHLPSAINLPSVSQPPFRPIVVVSQSHTSHPPASLLVSHLTAKNRLLFLVSINLPPKSQRFRTQRP